MPTHTPAERRKSRTTRVSKKAPLRTTRTHGKSAGKSQGTKRSTLKGKNASVKAKGRR